MIRSSGSPGNVSGSSPAASAISEVSGISSTRGSASAARSHFVAPPASVIRPRRSSVAISRQQAVGTPMRSESSIAARAAADNRESSSRHHRNACVSRTITGARDPSPPRAERSAPRRTRGTVTLPRRDGGGSIGSRRATGLPCLVTTIATPLSATSSRRARQCVLNWLAGIVRSMTWRVALMWSFYNDHGRITMVTFGLGRNDQARASACSRSAQSTSASSSPTESRSSPSGQRSPSQR